MATSSDSPVKLFTLNNGLQMPAIGLGTYRIRNAESTMNAVDAALASGYRLFDTASVYGNEIFLGNALKTLLPKYDLEREDIYITTKIAPTDHGAKSIVSRAYQRSLDHLGVEYVDMLLIHFPGTAKVLASDPLNREIRHVTWNSLCELYDDGVVNGIGVSNFTIAHIKALLKSNPGVVPSINQVEVHPYYQQKELLQFCQQQDIVVQAYCSMGGKSAQLVSLMDDPVIQNIASSLDVSCPQLLLAWALQQDISVIPKSTDPNHIKQNITINFRIPENEMKELCKLGVKNTKYAWDPTPVF